MKVPAGEPVQRGPRRARTNPARSIRSSVALHPSLSRSITGGTHRRATRQAARPLLALAEHLSGAFPDTFGGVVAPDMLQSDVDIFATRGWA